MKFAAALNDRGRYHNNRGERSRLITISRALRHLADVMKKEDVMKKKIGEVSGLAGC